MKRDYTYAEFCHPHRRAEALAKLIPARVDADDVCWRVREATSFF